MTSKMIAMPRTQKPHSGAWGALRASAIGLSMVVASTAWAAPTVVFVATDQADTVAGQDLWRYVYTITGPGDVLGLVNLLFDYTKYANLMSQTADPALSLQRDVQPDTGLPADGIVTVSLETGLAAAKTAAFLVDFVWLGGLAAAPGAQPFEYVDAAGFPAGGGRTSPQAGGGSVPEPSALLLAATALLALSARRKRGTSA